jgi:hypothetical protein
LTGRTTNDPKADEVLMGMHALAAALKVIQMIQRMKKSGEIVLGCGQSLTWPFPSPRF